MTRPLPAVVTAAVVAAVVASTAAAPGATPADDVAAPPAPATAPGTVLPVGDGPLALPASGERTEPTAARRPTPLAGPAPSVPVPEAPVVPPRTEPPAVVPVPTTTSAEGWTVAGGTELDPIDEGGPTVRWTLEVEPATGLDVAAVLGTATDALHDPRSWARSHRLERIDDPGRATVRVVVATPGTVDAICARAGLVTNGIFSCWSGRIAAINLMRWQEGTREIDDLALYRAYVVNHEVGHGLGRGHRACGGAGELADVMQQQTRTLGGCVANPWPYPDS